MLKEFKAFAMRGNVLDMAVGIIIGGAFGRIISSLVGDIIMPPFGLALGKVDFSTLFLNISGTPYPTLAAAKAANAAHRPNTTAPTFFMFCKDETFMVIRQTNWPVTLLLPALNDHGSRSIPESAGDFPPRSIPRPLHRNDAIPHTAPARTPPHHAESRSPGPNHLPTECTCVR